MNRLVAKDAEITRFVALRSGYGDPGALEIVARHRLDEEIEQLTEEFDEALTLGTNPLEWRAKELGSPTMNSEN